MRINPRTYTLCANERSHLTDALNVSIRYEKARIKRSVKPETIDAAQLHIAYCEDLLVKLMD